MAEKIDLYKSDAISTVEEDALGRAPFINAVVNFIESQSTGERENKVHRSIKDPLTIGIYGKWGYGKTSVINCVKAELDKKGFYTAHYNPWMYNSEDDLIKHLFETIISAATPLEKKYEIQMKFRKYFLGFIKGVKIDAKLGVPFIGQLGIAYDAKAIVETIEKDSEVNETVYDVKEQINKILMELANPIVIFIDDIDRLSKQEVYTLFKTVRLIADFKNIIYVLSFDDEMVAKSIKENFADGTDKDGFSYLDKIIDIPLRLPTIQTIFFSLYFSNLLMVKIGTALFNAQFNTIAQYLIETPRDCIRIVNSVGFIFFGLEKKINYDDLVLIESVRIKSPDLFKFIELYYQEVILKDNLQYFFGTKDFNV